MLLHLVDFWSLLLYFRLINKFTKILFIRTFRLAVVEGTEFGSASIGNLISGPIFSKTGFTGVFVTSAVFNMLSLSWIMFFLKEKRD